MYGTVFFDLDGTLTDPQLGIVRSIRHALDRLGVEALADDDLTWCIGPPLQVSLARLVGDVRVPQALRYYRERFGDIGWKENELYPGITEALTHLTTNGATLYVATSKPLVFAERILRHFELAEFFDRIFGSELDGTLSDKADLLRFALREARPSDTPTMVGDREHDIIGARANRLRSIGLTYGYGSREELVQAGADVIVETTSQISVALAQNTYCP
ncbi:MAG: HAD hydrolase-like protein [Pseudomonadota bacterium]